MAVENLTERVDFTHVKEIASKPKRGRLCEFMGAQLFSSAIKLIDERGHDALSLRSLGRYVGVLPATLYTHFADFDDLT